MGFIDKWKKEARRQIQLVRPDLTKEQLEKFLDNQIKKKMVNPPCKLDNNYRKKVVSSDLLTIYDWVEKNRPIIGGYGVFFKNQNQTVNRVAITVRGFIESRIRIKDEMKALLRERGPEDYEVKQKDRYQATEKICANSIYGAGGAKVAFFYNLYTAASTTGTAQSLISTTCAAFESFMAGNTRFYDTDEILHYINNITREVYKTPMDGIRLVDLDTCLNKLVNNAFEPKKINVKIVRRALENLTDEDWSRIYYKDNLYAFTGACDEVCFRLRKIMVETESFRAPKESLMTPALKKDLDIVWKLYSEFVHYNHPIYNRIYRLKTATRKSVLVIDTDSNMVLIMNWINMIMKCFIDERNTQSKEESLYTASSVICVFITNMISDTLALYCKKANILKDRIPNINMKNEFFFETLVTTEVKKNYLASTLLREGEAMHGKPDIKGLAFMKSETSKQVGEFFKNVIKEDIFKPKHINFANIIRKLNSLSGAIRESLLKGETTYAKLKSVKEPDKYAEPLSEMGIKAVMGWDAAYPDNPIELPDRVKLIKVNMTRAKDIEDLQYKEPEIYANLMKEIFNNPNKQISKAGLNAFAVPQISETIPEWLIPYIDVEQIVEDNTRSFFPVLKALSFDILNTRSGNKQYTNFLKL